MVICKMPALTDNHLQPRKAMKNAFRDPSQSDKMCFEYQTIKFQWKKWVKVFTFAYGQGRWADPPSPLLSGWP